MEMMFDMEQFKELLTDFHIITGIKIVFYDDNLTPVISVPAEDSDFCAAVKKSAVLLKRCEECIENEIKKCKKTNKLSIYNCHSGLTEAVAPIKIDDIIIGYIMIGQITDAVGEKKDEIVEYVSKYLGEDVGDKFDSLTFKNLSQIKATAKFMETLISYLIMHNLVKSDHTSLAFKITDYIGKNLSADLSVDNLSSIFGISRNSLYKIFNDFYGVSVAKYIRKKRIEAAINLISDGTTIADVSSIVGFGDYNYFSKVFKSETGTLPSKFRKSVMNK